MAGHRAWENLNAIALQHGLCGAKHVGHCGADQQPGKLRRGYLRGLPRLAKTTPRSSAVQRSELANLSASLRSGPGAIWRASSSASAAATSQSNRSDER